jgi:hypothetical protein
MFISSCHCNPRCSEINFVIPVVVKSCGNYSNTSIGCHALGANTTRAVAIAHRGTHRTSGKFLFHASACDELMPSIHRTPPGPTRRQLPGKMTGEWNFWFDSGQLAAHGSYDDDHKIGAWVYFDEDGTSLDYQEWSQKFSHWDWAYDDYSGFPRGENWPNPPAGAEVIPADESPVS